MNRYKIEDLLEIFYSDLYDEYKSEVFEKKVLCYNSYIDENTREKLNNGSLNMFDSKWCFPTKWIHPIYLFVSINPVVEIYFCSDVDLRNHIVKIINDKNFRCLVKCAMYIKENIKKKN